MLYILGKLLDFGINSFSSVQMSLYEDLVAAWVLTKHEWLRLRPLGEELINTLGKQRMYSYCARMWNFIIVAVVSPN